MQMLLFFAAAVSSTVRSMSPSLVQFVISTLPFPLSKPTSPPIESIFLWVAVRFAKFLHPLRLIVPSLAAGELPMMPPINALLAKVEGQKVMVALAPLTQSVRVQPVFERPMMPPALHSPSQVLEMGPSFLQLINVELPDSAIIPPTAIAQEPSAVAASLPVLMQSLKLEPAVLS